MSAVFSFASVPRTSGFLCGAITMSHVAFELSSYNKAKSSEADGTRCNAKEQMTMSHVGCCCVAPVGKSPLARSAKERAEHCRWVRDEYAELVY